MRTPAYNPIYERLVKGPDDAVGAFAYMLYKQHKVDYVISVQATHNRKPTEAEMTQFHQQNSLDTQIKSCTDRAEVLVQAFLNAGLEKRIGDIETDVRKSALGIRIENVQRTLDEKKTTRAWLAEVGGNLAVNLLTIIVIGFLVIGYKHLSSMNFFFEKNAGLTETTQKAQSQAPATNGPSSTKIAPASAPSASQRPAEQ